MSDNRIYFTLKGAEHRIWSFDENGRDGKYLMNGKFEESIFQTVTKLRLNHRNAIKCNRQGKPLS